MTQTLHGLIIDPLPLPKGRKGSDDRMMWWIVYVYHVKMIYGGWMQVCKSVL